MALFRGIGGRKFWLGLLARAVTLWIIVEFGFFKGTAGGNRFGPDPLAAANG